MENRIQGIHHITAIAGSAQRNYDFYTQVLGLRLVKKTVNFDDPGTYHFYFGDRTGTPGTILTFFPWTHVRRGRAGVGMATEIAYSVPAGSLDFWKERFSSRQIRFESEQEIFGESVMRFQDPDGLQLRLVVPEQTDPRIPWETEEVKFDHATRGFQGITLTLRNIEPTVEVLVDILGYHLQREENNHYRFVTDAVDRANRVDIVRIPNGAPGINAGGTIHHVAFSVKDEETQMKFREKVLEKGLDITPRIDRNYFYSLYFREPGGVLFEIATDNPGFAVDEPVSELGKNLKLPSQYEANREMIEKTLDPLKY